MVASIQLFGQSFVSRLKQFLRKQTQLPYNLRLSSSPLVQYTGYPGGTVETLRKNLSDITDFDPDIVVLLIGTNDLCRQDMDTLKITTAILDLVDTLLFVRQVKKVIICQILYRQPSEASRYPVNTDWFNSRVDETNHKLSSHIQELNHTRAIFWRFKGFWSPEAQATVFSSDGVHLSDSGQKKLYTNIRAAVVHALNLQQ